VPKKILTIKTT